MADSLNLNLYRTGEGALAPRSGRYQVTFTMLAAPLAFALGFAAIRNKRLRPLVSAFAVLGLARSAAQMLARRRDDRREQRIDEAVEDSFPASDPPALRP